MESSTTAIISAIQEASPQKAGIEDMSEQALRSLPSIDQLLRQEELQPIIASAGRDNVRDRLREVLAEVRAEVSKRDPPGSTAYRFRGR
jgi:hypothetical protein